MKRFRISALIFSAALSLLVPCSAFGDEKPKEATKAAATAAAKPATARPTCPARTR